MKKIILFAFLVVNFLTACNQQADTPNITEESQNKTENKTEATQLSNEIITQDVYYFDENDKVKGFLAMPKGAKDAPALILIHEWWGLNDNIRDLAQEFAKQGYVALAVDLYDGESTTERDVAQKLATNVRENMDPAFANLAAAVQYLHELSEVDDERIASVGWCFGGGWSYQMAKNDMGVKATVMYYGQFDPEDDFKHMKATILGHFGEDDASIKVDDVKEFQATLKTLSGNHEVYIYPNAGHGFANSDSSSYNKEAADLAWERTAEFLKKYL